LRKKVNNEGVAAVPLHDRKKPLKRRHMEVDMKARHIILTIAAVAVLAAPTTVLAQGGPGGGFGQHRGDAGWHGGGEGGDHLGFFERMLPRMADELSLSDEQLEKIEAILDAARPEIEGYAEQLRNGREAYRAANDDPTVFDEGAFLVHAAAQHEIQTKLMVVVGNAKAEVFSVLNEEQRQQLEEMRGSFGRKASRRGGGRRSGSR
jgi:Spy/CpxP family protein refolding chaperone